MNNYGSKSPGSISVILAFLTVYIVWGSTYFFISKALHGFPPFLLGGIRFVIAGLIMMNMGSLEKRKSFGLGNHQVVCCQWISHSVYRKWYCNFC